VACRKWHSEGHALGSACTRGGDHTTACAASVPPVSLAPHVSPSSSYTPAGAGGPALGVAGHSKANMNWTQACTPHGAQIVSGGSGGRCGNIAAGSDDSGDSSKAYVMEGGRGRKGEAKE